MFRNHLKSAFRSLERNKVYSIINIESKQNDQNGNTGFLQGPTFTQNVPGIKYFVRLEGGFEADAKYQRIKNIFYVEELF